MISYLKHERKVLGKKIRELYIRNEEHMDAELLNTPLRELKVERGSSIYKDLALSIDGYIHKYNVRVNKDITLENALKKII